MYHRLFVHLVWTTRDRAAIIDRESAAYLAEHLPIIARQERSRILELGVVATHVHLLLRAHPMTQFPRLLQRMKGVTAQRINQRAAIAPKQLRWAKGYSITSVSPRGLASATAYVRHQYLRHPEAAIAGWDPEDS